MGRQSSTFISRRLDSEENGIIQKLLSEDALSGKNTQARGFRVMTHAENPHKDNLQHPLTYNYRGQFNRIACSRERGCDSSPVLSTLGRPWSMDLECAAALPSWYYYRLRKIREKIRVVAG